MSPPASSIYPSLFSTAPLHPTLRYGGVESSPPPLAACPLLLLLRGICTPTFPTIFLHLPDVGLPSRLVCHPGRYPPHSPDPPPPSSSEKLGLLCLNRRLASLDYSGNLGPGSFGLSQSPQPRVLRCLVRRQSRADVPLEQLQHKESPVYCDIPREGLELYWYCIRTAVMASVCRSCH